MTAQEALNLGKERALTEAYRLINLNASHGCIIYETTGEIGQHVVRTLVSKGYSVTPYGTNGFLIRWNNNEI